MRRTVFCLVLSSLGVLHASAFLGCGGSTIDDVFGVPGSGSGKGGNDASAPDAIEEVDAAADDAGVVVTSTDAGTDGRPDAPPLTCEQLSALIDVARAKLIECKTSTLNQCNKLVRDVCCDLTITASQAGTQAGTRFRAALDAFDKAKCKAQCNDVLCPALPTGLCVPGAVGGTCLQ